MPRSNKGYIWLVSIISGIIFLFFLLQLPINMYIEKPGSTLNSSKFIRVGGMQDKTGGSLSIVSVTINDARVLDSVLSATHSKAEGELLPKENVTGDLSMSDYQKLSDLDMKQSFNNAVIEAFNLANKSEAVSKTFNGIFVTSIDSKSKFKGGLKIGDLIQKINGQSFITSADILSYIRGLEKNADINLEIKRGEENKTLTAKTISVKGNTAIGITMAEDIDVSTNPEVKNELKNVGGPSAGLMFTLQIYSQVSGVDIKEDRKIAGTGTIDTEGKVGEIGGVDKKIVAASKDGKKIFFVPYVKPTKEYPDTNWVVAKRTVKELGLKIKLVKVATVNDALNYLENK